ncbi:uncharacterized protein MELLADRAFT_107139 [Melampsora larici-populina 98AG31]|uniref:Uncharacterized protein n=1 Tax=Melampsora larici-populina (strain 98AG31 / pathotype 3-4-7) TaxID=747676 RepID=F4RNZ4_MELLP|nr:uncharacterized protein MELLADRAFT_107139 [Melampsora larici-populina 98AG31]EGG05732.1 hypothetical protein MELLADRAFT_107139 [Melampsora larici-populina 98AG31]
MVTLVPSCDYSKSSCLQRRHVGGRLQRGEMSILLVLMKILHQYPRDSLYIRAGTTAERDTFDTWSQSARQASDRMCCAYQHVRVPGFQSRSTLQHIDFCDNQYVFVTGNYKAIVWCEAVAGITVGGFIYCKR